jgi:DNA-directed RNA polymerase subunit H (RpoH/RPB5)
MIYKSRKTVLDLMNKQGYNTSDYENFSINEVNSMMQNNQMDMLLEREKPVKRKMYIRYFLTKSLRPQNIQEMLDDLFSLEEILTKEDTLFIVIKEEINETITNMLKHIWEQDGIFIVIQNIKRLQFNILNHSLVPSHRVLTDEELTTVKKRYNIKEDGQIPDISRFDPVAQVIGLRPGQVCEIIRPSKTAIQAYYYRICV